jgi:O-antigen/teichoic acid export membrane protein
VVCQATGHPGISARFAVINALVNLVLFLVFIPRFGIVGAAATFMLTQVIQFPWFVNSADRLLEIRLRTLFVRAYLPVSASLAAACLVCWLLRPLASSLSSLAGIGVVGVATYLLVTSRIVLDERERVTCWALAAGRILPVMQFLGVSGGKVER